jgi:ABC-2 type transport system ATP-binding protein
MLDNNVCAQVSNLTKSYGKGKIKALDSVNLSIETGEIVGLIGPNGSGKTTLVGCLLGLLKPDSGDVKIFGKDPDFSSVHKLIGYMPERPDFEHWMTGWQFLEYHHGLARLNANNAKKTIEELLEFVELPSDAWTRRLKTYSRGMLQRLNLAQGLLTDPKFLLMDEPTLGLDPAGVSVVRKIVGRLREKGATAVINSHQLDEIERLCDRVAFIKHGKIAVIEKLKGQDFCDYVISIKWSLNGFTGGEPDLAALAIEAGSVLKEQKLQTARFVVKDSQAAGYLIKKLVTAGLLVEEATPERARLEQLFLEQGGSD